MTKKLALIGLAAFLAASSIVGAQVPVRRGYVQGLLVLAAQPDGEFSGHWRILPAFGGSGLGLTGSAGYFITPAVAIEGNVLSAGISSDQEFSYMNDRQEYTSTVRVVALNGLLRYRPGGTSPVELVIGGGLAATTLKKHDGTHYYLFPPPGQPPMSPMLESSQTEWAPTVAGGADLVLPTRSRAAFVAGIRARWRVGVELDGFNGISAFALDMGVGMRVRF